METIQELELLESPELTFDEYNSISAHAESLPAQGIAMSSDGEFLAAFGYAESVYRNIRGILIIWNVNELDLPIALFQTPISYPTAITFNNTGEFIAIGGCMTDYHCNPSTILVINWRMRAVKYSIAYSRPGIIQMQFIDDQNLLLQDQNNKTDIVDIPLGQVMRSWNTLSSGAYSFGLDGRRELLALSGVDGIMLLEPGSYHSSGLLPSLPGRYGFGAVIAAGYGRKVLAVGGCETIGDEACTRSEVHLWELPNTTAPYLVTSVQGAVTSLAFNPADEILAAGGDTGIHFWFTSTGEEIPSDDETQSVVIVNLVFFHDNLHFAALSNLGILVGEIKSDLSAWTFTSLDRFGVGRAYILGTGDDCPELYEEPDVLSRMIDIPPGEETITVLEGPEIRNGNTWWWMRTESGITGWIYELPGCFTPQP